MVFEGALERDIVIYILDRAYSLFALSERKLWNTPEYTGIPWNSVARCFLIMGAGCVGVCIYVGSRVP